MTTERNIIIHAGQTFELSLDYAGTAGRGQRMHIRASDAAADVIAILSHDGDANARVVYDGTDSLDITIGASVNGGWLVGANRVEWVYDIEDYDLSDTDDVVIAYRGKAIIYGNRTRPEDVTPSAALPSGDGRYVRFDGVQGLTEEQQQQARDNIGVTGGGGGSSAWGGITGTLSDQADLQAALDAKAPLASPTLTGTPAAPTAAGGTSTTQIATTAFVGAAVSTHAGAADPHGDRAYTDTQIAGRQAASATLTTLSSATAAGLALMDDATAADQRTTLGLGTAATHNVPVSGNAASGEVVKGNDTRLDVAATVHAATAASLADADEQGFWQSASSALRKITWSNIKATLKAYFDTLYAAASHNQSASTITSGTLDAARLPAASETAQGAVELATTAEALTGTDTARAVTPAGVKAVADTKAASSHTHAASDITSGTVATARLGSGTANSTTFLRGDQTWAAVSASPGGSDTQVLFNDGGSAAGDSGLTYNKTTDTLTVAGPVLRSGSGTRILIGTGTGASDICLWTTATGLAAVNGSNSLIQNFRASTITADSAFINGSGGLQYSGTWGWGSLNSGLTTFVRHTASELCVTGATTTYDTILTRSAANTLALRNATNAQTFLVGGTWTDASNYVQGSLAATSTAVTLSAITAGTGADNVPVNINAAGTSPVAFGSPAQAKSYTVATVPSASASGAGAIIYVTDESGGAVLAFSDATDWRRVTDRAVIS